MDRLHIEPNSQERLGDFVMRAWSLSRSLDQASYVCDATNTTQCGLSDMCSICQHFFALALDESGEVPGEPDKIEVCSRVHPHYSHSDPFDQQRREDSRPAVSAGFQYGSSNHTNTHNTPKCTSLLVSSQVYIMLLCRIAVKRQG